MDSLDRRDFLKSACVFAGAAALTAATPTWAARDKASGGKGQVYEIFSLKYAGPFDRKLAMVLYNTGWNDNIQVNYYLWVVRAQNGDITLVDTGTGPTLAKERKVPAFVQPEQMVARLGIKPEQVTKVIITHMHFDHAGGMETFPQSYPKAKFYVQKRDMDFWTKDPMAKRGPFRHMRYDIVNEGVLAAQKAGRLVIVDGDKTIGPDMTLLLTPGHSPGLQSVLLHTAKGPAVLASDCAHIARSFQEDIPSALVWELPIWLTTYEKLRSKAPVENLFPGHDALLLTNYPKVAEDITQLA